MFARLKSKQKGNAELFPYDEAKHEAVIRCSICCCVSATQTCKEMQFFGERANLAKALWYAINGVVDEK